MEERDGQHMGVVTNALEKCVPPCSMIRRVLFMTCMEPGWEREWKKIYHILLKVTKSALPIALLQRELTSSFSLPLHNTRHRWDKDISSFIYSLFVTSQTLRGNVLVVCNLGIHVTPATCVFVCVHECVCLETYDTGFIFTSHTLFIKSLNYSIYFSKPLSFHFSSAFIRPGLAQINTQTFI